MSIIYTPGFTFGAPPSRRPEDGYRFYLCELRSTTWTCEPISGPTTKPSENPFVLETKIQTVWKPLPKFIDPLVLSYKCNGLLHMKFSKD
jgi:hypothetical protein